jgi:hypothetical protein
MPGSPKGTRDGREPATHGPGCTGATKEPTRRRRPRSLRRRRRWSDHARRFDRHDAGVARESAPFSVRTGTSARRASPRYAGAMTTSRQRSRRSARSASGRASRRCRGSRSSSPPTIDGASDRVVHYPGGPTTPTRPTGLPLVRWRLDRLSCCRTLLTSEQLSPSAHERARREGRTIDLNKPIALSRLTQPISPR